MTTTEANTITYERPADSLPAAQAKEHSTFRFPGLFWSCILLFAANLLVFIGVAVSPRLQVNMYGEDIAHKPVYYRPSPFAEKIETTAARRPKSATKVRPVVYEQPQAPAAEWWMHSSWHPQEGAEHQDALHRSDAAASQDRRAQVYQTAERSGVAARRVTTLVADQTSAY